MPCRTCSHQPGEERTADGRQGPGEHLYDWHHGQARPRRTGEAQDTWHYSAPGQRQKPAEGQDQSFKL